MIELLVVVSIIALLIAILLPALSRARAVAEDVVCRTKLHTISLAFFMFSGDHNQRLPSVYWTHYTEEWKNSWMGDEIWPAVPKQGTLVKYVGGVGIITSKNLYRCPGLADGKLGSGIGSNGMFDYSSFISLAGASRSGIPTNATLTDPGTGRESNVPMPVIVEEDPANYINFTSIEPGHANMDRLGTWHPDNSGNYGAADGSVQHFEFTSLGATPILDWHARAPSGAIVNLQHLFIGPGEWDQR